jgi:hypothetical protein
MWADPETEAAPDRKPDSDEGKPGPDVEHDCD